MTTTNPGSVDTGHVYDDIHEHDNKLPRWWLITLYSTIVFSIGYWAVYHLYQREPHPAQVFAQDYAEYEKQQAEIQAKLLASIDDAKLEQMAKDAATVERGKAIYTTNCQACHADKGQGLVGPNLTDPYWIHGTSPLGLLAVVNDGVPAKGMPAWKPVLGAQACVDALAYVLTLRGTNVPGKAAEGVDAGGKAAPTAAPPAPAPAPAPAP